MKFRSCIKIAAAVAIVALADGYGTEKKKRWVPVTIRKKQGE